MLSLIAAVGLLGAGAWAVAAREADPPSGSARAAEARRPVVTHWFGEQFEGLPVTDRTRSSVIYGDCDASEGGCTAPLEVQSLSICRRHPLEIDVLPSAIRRARGALVVSYGDQIEVLTATTTAVIFANDRRLLPRALAALRPVDQYRPSPLRPARLPRWASRELRLIQSLRQDGQSLRAMRTKLGISVSAIRSRLRLARVLGADALRGVRPARIMPGEVIRDRHAWIARREGFMDRKDPEMVRRARRHAARVKRC